MPSSVPKGHDWRVDVLHTLGAPVTAANLYFLTSWQLSEGGDTHNSAHWNYLNTTSGPGTSINSVGVKSFPDYATGIRETASTIANGRYGNVIRGLKSGDPYNPKLREGLLGDLSTWVSGSRSANLGYGSTILNRRPTKEELGPIVKGILSGQIHPKDLPPGITVKQTPGDFWGTGVKAIDKPAAAVVDAVLTPAKALKWLFDNWDRTAEVVGGFVLVLIGLVLMGRSLGVTKTKVEVIQRALPGGDSRAVQAAAAAAEERAYTRAAASAGRARARGEALGARRRSVPAIADEPRARRSSGYDPATAEIPY